MPINDPGVRENEAGTVIQGAKRSKQVEGIADSITAILNKGQVGTRGKVIYNDDLHKIRGWMEQLRIIADELKSVSK